MDEHVIVGNPPVRVALRSSSRARKLSLRISRLDGRVTLTRPGSVPLAEAIAFAESREAWLRRHLAGIGEAESPRLGGSIPFEGVDLPLVAAPVRAPLLQDGRLLLPDEPEKVSARTEAFLINAARSRIVAGCERHSAALGRAFGRVTLRDTRSRWGSCSSRGDLMFSWRLVMAPPDVLDYVIAHEVAHLERMDHSPAFWSVVERLRPDYREQRRWLREHGERLHRVRFGT